MKKTIINVLLVLSILFLFLSLIILTGIFLWESRSVIAKNFGVQLKDNCKITDATLSCGYVKALSKDFKLDLKNFSLGFNFTNYIRGDQPFIDLKLEEGNLYIRAKKKKRKTEKSFLAYTYFLIYFVRSDIKKLNLKVDFPDGKRFSVKDFSFLNDFDTFFSYRPFLVDFDGISARIEKLKGIIAPDELIFEQILTYLNGNPLKIRGSLGYSGNFGFSGHFSGEDLAYKEFSLKNFDIGFDISRFNRMLIGNVVYSVETANFRKISAEGLKGKIHFEGVEKLKGYTGLEIPKLKIGRLITEKIKSSGNFTYTFKDKKLELTASADAHFSQISRIKLENISSKFRIKYFKDIFLEGEAKSGKISAKYLYRDKRLSVETADFNIQDLLETAFLLDEKTKYINGFGKGKIEVKEGKTTAYFSFKDLNIYGIRFDVGKVRSEIDNRSFSGNYIFDLRTDTGFCFVSGGFDKNFVDGDITFDNINLEGFIYGKKFRFGGLIDGSGRFSGHLPVLNVDIRGSSEIFYYRSIYVKNYSYIFRYFGWDRKIFLSFKDQDKKLLGDLNLSLKPFSLTLKLEGKNKDISFTKDYLKSIVPAVFSQITPKNVTGGIKVFVQKRNWKIDFNLKKGSAVVDTAGDTLNFSAEGSISNREKLLKVEFHKDNFRFRKDYILKKVKGDVHLSDKKVNLKINGEGFNLLDEMLFKGEAVYYLDKKNIHGSFSLFTKKGDFTNDIKTEFSGKLKNITGSLFEIGKLKNRKIVETKVEYSFSILQKHLKASVKSDRFKIVLPEKFQVQFYDIKGNITIPYKDPFMSTGNLRISKFTTSKNYIYFFDSSPVELYLKNGVITGKKVDFTGIIRGKINRLEYNIKQNSLILSSDGFIDRNLLSIVIKYINTSGDLEYSFDFDGKLKDFEKNFRLKIFSEDLGLRTAYSIGIIQLKKFLLDVEKGNLDLKLSGSSPDVILGESAVSITGRGNLQKKFVYLEGFTRFFPVKYMNIFQGNLNSSIKIKTTAGKGRTKTDINGKISLSGRVKLEKDLNQILSLRKNRIKKEYKNENLKDINLDIYAESYIPIYLYGKWGKAYSEFNLKIKGTAEKPLIDGDISIIYGEIYFLRNRYNIDFANIKIIQNDPYISARISTSIADTFIFIDLTGSLYNPRINFSSSPPKSKDEILSILLLRDTPSALENMPVFKTVGKILYTFLPFKPSEERGLFNTGFEINILPQYSPTTGISASVYAKRSLTRRIFVALSKPLGQLEEEKIGGWYGIGLKIKERTSFQYKFFETGNQEFDIVFNFPFDF